MTSSYTRAHVPPDVGHVGKKSCGNSGGGARDEPAFQLFLREFLTAQDYLHSLWVDFMVELRGKEPVVMCGRREGQW